MKTVPAGSIRRVPLLAVLILAAWRFSLPAARANPNGGSAAQGTASFNTSGSTLTINTSDRAYLNWQSFNIGLGETTTFVQPSSTSVVWNQINDANPSQILGNLNANGYVILQNQSGFYVGGQASITAHGLLMTTAPSPMPDLSSGSAWQFNAPPPTAKIINYGQINLDPGGSVYLIAHDIENHGGISAPGGDLGLYAGKEVLVSSRPDGRGLSAQVTLPQGSVDNSGKLIADAGTIALHAQVVNQGGLVQANSVREVNGVIELVAGDAVNLGANSVISAQGDSQGASPGGKVTIKSDNTFSDQPSSVINVPGGAQGGNGGQIEISAASLIGIQSRIDGHAAGGFLGGEFTLDPADLLLNSTFVNSLAPVLNAGLYEINLQADHDIELSTAWSLADPGATAKLTLTAGNNIILDDGSAIKAGNNWSVAMSAGTAFVPTLAQPRPDSGSDGIYLLGNSFIQTQNGNISLSAANQVVINAASDNPNNAQPINVTLLNGRTMDALNSGNGVGSGSAWNGIRTLKGGGISVTTQYGDVFTGGNYNGYVFGLTTAPYYKVNSAILGGISTAAGGDVSISAGGNITSYLPSQSDLNAVFDGGTGAFGPQPGTVTISAGGSVSGNYVLANGTGTVTSQGDIGPVQTTSGFALSLVKGSWSVYAPNGSIFLEDVLNPNGVFNDAQRPAAAAAGYHNFDYDPLSSLLLQAGNSVEITGVGVPLLPASASDPLPILFPPSLTVIAGSGGFVLDTTVILFPSPYGNLNVTTLNGGNFIGAPVAAGPDQTPATPVLEMSDSGGTQWTDVTSFGPDDHASIPPELNNPDPVRITVSGNMENLTVHTTKATTLTVGGDIINAGFEGQNQHPGDVTSINVTGQIYNTPGLTFVQLDNPIVGANPVQPSAWDYAFNLAVEPSVVNLDTRLLSPETLRNLIKNLLLFPVLDTTRLGGNPGFIYDPATLQLGFNGRMNQSVAMALEAPLTLLVVDSSGKPVIDANGHLEVQAAPYTFAPAAKINDLYLASQVVPTIAPVGYHISGPGQFDINAASMELGNTLGVVSDSGAAINLNLEGNLHMLTSTIHSTGGGDVTVNSVAGELDLGVQNNFSSSGIASGIWTSGHSNVRVTAGGDVNVDGSRIATYNGGDVFVESFNGNVNAGSGGNTYVNVPPFPNPIYGSGLLTVSQPPGLQTPGGNPLPGNITVLTPRGDIISTQAGILQYAVDGNFPAGPMISLVAGTAASGTSPAIPGNIELGDSGVIGGTINATAQGNIQGLIISHQNSTVNAALNFSGTVLAAGTANLSAGGSVSGTIIGVGGVNATGGGGISASLLGQNVSVNGGAGASTLGTTASATGASQSAANQANSDAQQQATGNNTSEDDPLKRKGGPLLTRRVPRVTVILPNG